METDRNIDTNTSTYTPDLTPDVDSSPDRERDRDNVDIDRSHERDERDRGREKRRDRPSVRDTIRQSFDDAARQEEETPERVASESDQIDQGTQTPTEPKKADIPAPTSWTKEAKDAWSNVPDRIKQEVTKRETDMQKGVDALKSQYKEIDDALTPYQGVIRQFQKTPGQAVTQLFAWFDALAQNPDQAFPALLQSYKYEPARLLAAYGIDPNELAQFIQYKQQYMAAQQQQQQTQAQPGQGGTPEEISPAVRQYIGALHNELAELKNQVGYHFNSQAQYFAEQNQARTQEQLERWAADKPYFNEVRVMMGHLLTPDPQTGMAAVPLKDGRVDLDTAYEMAIHALPDVRTRVWQEYQSQQAAQAEAARKAKAEADFKAQQEKANRARRAAGSITTSAPGAQIARQPGPQKGMSVRESLKAAIAEIAQN